MKKLSSLLRAWRSGLLALLLMGACVAPAAAAPSCSGYAGNLVFGTVDVLSSGNTDTSSTITYGCSSNPGDQILLCVSMGADPTTHGYDPRYLSWTNNGVTSRMAFNMYSDTARSIVWGAIGAGSSYAPVPLTMTFPSGVYYQTATVTLYGRVKSAGQGALPAGTYDTNSIGGWPMTISYKTYTGSTVPSCSSGGMSTNSSTFYIQATVVSDCVLDSSTTMDFGTVFQTLSQNIDTTATIVVTCNGGQSGNGYYVMLGDGQNAVSSGGQRRMQGPGGALLNYELYKDSTRQTRWGNSTYLGVAGTGNGQPQSLTVYGRVPPQTVPAVGKYTDTVVITLSY